MFLITVFIALSLSQHVMSLLGITSSRINRTKSLLKRDNPTFAIDRSCNRFPQVPAVVNDWQQTAQITAHRMSLGDADPHFQWAFQVIFGTTMDDPQQYEFDSYEPCTAFEFAQHVTSNIASFIPWQNQAVRPNLIYYCDDDAINPVPYTRERWQVCPNVAGDPVPNSMRTDGVDKEWFDQFNFVTRDPTTSGCQDGADIADRPTWMETFRQEIIPFVYGNQRLPVGLRRQRSTITICDRTFDPANEFYPTIPASVPFTISPRGGRPLALYRTFYDRIMSAVMYHESTHWAGVELEDTILEDGSEAYGWQNIQRIDDPKDRLVNADSYMFLGLLARYESLGYWLDPHEGRSGLGVIVRAPRGWVAP
ncbi:hypothetical protein BDR22DRAFT_885245 [Usnea florida]